MSTHHVQADRPADLLKSLATVAWLFLVIATVASWALGTDHGFVDDHQVASVTILVVAFVKVRFIGLYFMELRDAPIGLRVPLEAYCLLACATTISFYLAG